MTNLSSSPNKVTNFSENIDMSYEDISMSWQLTIILENNYVNNKVLKKSVSIYHLEKKTTFLLSLRYILKNYLPP